MSGYVVDTHVLLWSMKDDDRLKPEHAAIIGSTSAIFVSMATLWEIAIKQSLGKLDVTPDFHDAIHRAGYGVLAIDRAHVDEVRVLPHHHGDPFDRMIIAQARCERLTILTVDRHFSAYQVDVV